LRPGLVHIQVPASAFLSLRLNRKRKPRRPPRGGRFSQSSNDVMVWSFCLVVVCFSQYLPQHSRAGAFETISDVTAGRVTLFTALARNGPEFHVRHFLNGWRSTEKLMRFETEHPSKCCWEALTLVSVVTNVPVIEPPCCLDRFSVFTSSCCNFRKC
jgi:hypothetical protein